ncbi:MAG: YceI family protein [Planctomycetota bacterium]
MSRRLSSIALASVVAIAGVSVVPHIRSAPAAVMQESTSYEIDSLHSTIVFSALYMGQSPFYGMFTATSGTMTYDGTNPSTLQVDITAPLASLDTHNSDRDAHLKSPDWFNAPEHPNVRFVGGSPSDNGDGTMTMQGELTLNGQTNPVTVTVQHLKAGNTPRGQRMGLGATFTIKRTDFGVNTMVGENGIGDEITLHVGLQGLAG